MRLTNIYTWAPENAGAVYQRFEDFGRGEAPDAVKEAFANLKVVAWEKLAENTVIQVIEGDEASLFTWIGYWDDLGESDPTPSWDLTDTGMLTKLTPPAFMRQ